MHPVLLRLFVLCLVPVLVGGCFWRKPAEEPRCVESREYQKSRTVTGITVPEDLDAVGENSGLVIPEATGEAADGRCLDLPPDYFRKEDAAAPAAGG